MNLPTKAELEDAAAALRYIENTGRAEALFRAIADGRLAVCVLHREDPVYSGESFYAPATSIPDLP
jgi:hypothetical protein